MKTMYATTREGGGTYAAQLYDRSMRPLPIKATCTSGEEEAVKACVRKFRTGAEAKNLVRAVDCPPVAEMAKQFEMKRTVKTKLWVFEVVS